MVDNRSATHAPTPSVGSVWGRQEINKTVSSGLFKCPVEQTERAYWRHRVRAWHTLFSIPLVPGDVREEYVECFCCGATFDPRILTSRHPSLDTPRNR